MAPPAPYADRSLSVSSGCGELRNARSALSTVALGAALLAFELYVLGAWVTGPNFKRTPTGPDGSSDFA